EGDWVWLDSNVNWSAAIFEGPDGLWAVELGINAAMEMPAMLSGQSFGLMVDLGADGSQGSWPNGASATDSSSWRSVDNVLCN
ncbi:MAG: hypothetical protein PVH18_11715, partial [Chloroflexota bacterium]